MGRLLLEMRAGGLFRELGFVRLGDYVGERLGLGYRTAQELMRAEETLAQLPVAAAAFERGRITSGHVRALTRVATPESERFWVELARRSSVREFTWAVSRHAGAPEPPGSAAGADDEPPVLERLRIAVPAWMAGLWRETVTHVRWLVGQFVPSGPCLEFVLAELVGSPPEAVGPPGEGRSTGPRALEPAGAPEARREVCDAGIEDDRAGIGEGVAGAAAVNDSPSDMDARAIDRELRRLITERQRQEAELASLLRSMTAERAYRRDGFPSLEEYARERFGLSPRQTYYLLALHRSLEPLPAVSAAFLAGQVTLRKALLIAGVATRSTEALWIDRAVDVTLRRLEDEVTYWRHLRETRPEVWALLHGGPLPEDLALVPGQPPRLRKTDEAQRECATPRDCRSAARGDVELHGSAPSSPVSAEQFLKALNDAEAALPLPSRVCHLRMNVEPDLMEMWRERVSHLRATVREDLAEWEVLALALRDFWRTWDNAETRRQRRENRTLERDGWRCTAPGCRSVGSGRLHEHHIVFRSAGGPLSDASNLTTLCTGHHLGLLHRERMRCEGQAPDQLTWEMGIQPGKAPFLLFENERLIAGAS